MHITPTPLRPSSLKALPCQRLPLTRHINVDISTRFALTYPTYPFRTTKPKSTPTLPTIVSPPRRSIPKDSQNIPIDTLKDDEVTDTFDIPPLNPAAPNPGILTTDASNTPRAAANDGTGPGAATAAASTPRSSPEPARGGGFRPVRGARYRTWFKAMGIGMGGSLSDLRGQDSPDLLGGDLEDYAAPAAFYSSQSGLLGKVVWEGIVGLDVLIAELNEVLQFTGEEISGFDFRFVYDAWEYEYQVTESIAGKTNVVVRQVDRG